MRRQQSRSTSSWGATIILSGRVRSLQPRGRNHVGRLSPVPMSVQSSGGTMADKIVVTSEVPPAAPVTAEMPAVAPVTAEVPAVAPVPPKAPVVIPPDGLVLTQELIASLKAKVAESAGKHDIPIDPWMFNGGTVLVLVLTALATFLPTVLDTGQATWAAPLCSAVTGLFIAMERALGFGARWRFHTEMENAYVAIGDMLDFYPMLPASEQSKYARDIFSALYAVRSRESAIPNAGTNAAAT